MSKEQADKLRTWIRPKQLMIHTLKQNIALAKFKFKQSKENLDGGWFVRQQKQKIIEATTEFERESQKFELEKLESDIKNGFIGRSDEMAIKEFELQLQVEKNSLNEIRKGIIKASRNHNVPAQSKKEAKAKDEANKVNPPEDTK